MSVLSFPPDRRFDLACLGRLAVDLYAQQTGARLEDATSFAKYLGGSSANIAFGVARLGLRSAMVSRVGAEQMGKFLTETLQREGCDTSQVQIDPQRLTALVLLGLKDRDTFPLIFYRENCADMAVDAALISEDFIANCRALLITGTHLSTPTVRAASSAALGFAKKHGVVRVLDIDYRPVLWGLTARGDGETRYVADAHVTAQLQEMLPRTTPCRLAWESAALDAARTVGVLRCVPVMSSARQPAMKSSLINAASTAMSAQFSR